MDAQRLGTVPGAPDFPSGFVALVCDRIAPQSRSEGSASRNVLSGVQSISNADVHAWVLIEAGLRQLSQDRVPRPRAGGDNEDL